MLKRLFIFALCLVFSLTLIAGGMFAVDYYQCHQLEKPIFAIAADTVDDGGSGTYRGIFYTVAIDGELTVEYGYVVYSAEMYVLNRLVFAAIT